MIWQLHHKINITVMNSGQMTQNYNKSWLDKHKMGNKETKQPLSRSPLLRLAKAQRRLAAGSPSDELASGHGFEIWEHYDLNLQHGLWHPTHNYMVQFHNIQAHLNSHAKLQNVYEFNYNILHKLRTWSGTICQMRAQNDITCKLRH